MNGRRCGWCLEFGHVAGDCPKASAFVQAHATEDPRSDADDAFDALRGRMIGYRVLVGQLMRLCRENNVTIPLAILDLNPDGPSE